ncbi:uncharacterized protein LOC110465288 [Mizuhopecten yessoensis]|uniref:uncharacterized protein LOC110465288 n=1 Tax=Mizuhopecten yessoensis TaxID=6573 RepID=UPI000B45BAE4|nr:uncharacterized protein LOC110465288 [Mizuhopecten yessoensis]
MDHGISKERSKLLTKKTQFAPIDVDNFLPRQHVFPTTSQGQTMSTVVTSNVTAPEERILPTSSIAKRVNAANSTETNRDVGDVKKKWQDISSLTKRKEAQRIRERQATGGGPYMEDDAKPWEKIVSKPITTTN